MRDKAGLLGMLDGLPMLPVAREDEVRVLIEARRLFGRGIGFVDAPLLASCLHVPGTRLWTRDRKLDAMAAEVGCLRRDLVWSPDAADPQKCEVVAAEACLL